MKKLIVFFNVFGLFVSVHVFAAHYACIGQDKHSVTNGFLSSTIDDEYYYCGHVGDKGCADGDVVRGDLGVRDLLWKCEKHKWVGVNETEIPDCSMDKELPSSLNAISKESRYLLCGEHDERTLSDGEVVSSYAIKDGVSGVCKVDLEKARKNCQDSGGTLDGALCDCSGEAYTAGPNKIAPCECKEGFKRGDDNKCWPAQYVDGKCLRYSDNWYNCPVPNVGNSANGIHFYYFSSCAIYRDYRHCNSNGKMVRFDTIACPGISEDIARNAYNNSGNYTFGTDADGFECIKPSSKYNYKPCSSDSDCTSIDNKKSPYQHSTAWHCAYQSKDVRVCTPTKCESGWTPVNGFCQVDTAKSQTQVKSGDNSDEKNAVSPSTGTKPAQKKICSDSQYMDANCKCTVVSETVERGGKCVCIDANKEIKNGKCEYSAAYQDKLRADIDTVYKRVMDKIGGLEKSVWKNEKGEFNTARLASDSIAGVVLGTVGGLVTANVVKKSQVRKGFEDIKCSIGGQSVANFGDEFTVGR